MCRCLVGPHRSSVGVHRVHSNASLSTGARDHGLVQSYHVPIAQGRDGWVSMPRCRPMRGWTERMRGGTKVAPQTSYYLNSARPDACSTLTGLERLQTDLCRALGRV